MSMAYTAIRVLYAYTVYLVIFEDSSLLSITNVKEVIFCYMEGTCVPQSLSYFKVLCYMNLVNSCFQLYVMPVCHVEGEGAGGGVPPPARSAEEKLEQYADKFSGYKACLHVAISWLKIRGAQPPHSAAKLRGWSPPCPPLFSATVKLGHPV